MKNVLAKIDAENRGISGLGCSGHYLLLLFVTVLCREETGRTIPLMVSVRARRAAATYAIERGLSHRRACTLLNVARSALNYCSRLTAKDAPVLQRMSELSSQYPRYGYRRIAIFMRRDGHAMSFGRASRLWRDAQLQVPRKRGQKRVASGRPRPNTPTGANQVWSYDFVFDWCTNGQKLKCLTVTDE